MDTTDSIEPSFKPNPAVLFEVMQRVDSLETVLEQEFEALKIQDLDHLDRLLNAKNTLLEEIGVMTGVKNPQDADELDDSWQNFRSKMLYCRNLHRRNEILILRKLDAIRGALKSLQIMDPSSSVEVYDRLGRLNRIKRSRNYMAT
ncbi:MAG: flagellar protein FlgN [Betaproteobacteria bacterium]|jgi:flagellar biosynthesis/type III secretory pathway chaperone